MSNTNPLLYTLGILSMVLAIGLFVFSLYIMPHILFGIIYDVPEFIIIVTYWYSVIKGLSGLQLAGTILLPYLLSATILGLIARRLTSKFEVDDKRDIDFSKQSFTELMQPVYYELVLIAAVLFSLFFAVYVIIMQFN